MSTAYSRIQAAIYGIADAASDILAKVLLGTPGSQVEYPVASPDDEAVSQARDTGGLWAGQLVPTILQGLGVELDRAYIAWGVWLTNGTGITPAEQNGVGISACAKDEGSKHVIFTFSPAFADADYFCCSFCYGQHFVTHFSGQTSNTAEFHYHSVGAVEQDVNDRRILIVAVGQPSS